MCWMRRLPLGIFRSGSITEVISEHESEPTAWPSPSQACQDEAVWQVSDLHLDKLPQAALARLFMTRKILGF